jgi:DNA-binding MarR family transcriptional regulator
MGGMPGRRRDLADDHVARWTDYWKGDPAYEPEIEGALVRMQAIIAALRRGEAAAFAGSEFSIEDYKTLHALMIHADPPEATAAQLADAAHVSRAAMTSRLDRLVVAGLVIRDGDPGDRRRVVVRPTARGRSTWKHFVHEATQHEQQLLRVLSRGELQRLNVLLRKVILALDGGH